MMRARSSSWRPSARSPREPGSADFAYNRPVMIRRLRDRSWVGIVGSLTLHTLFAIGVWGVMEWMSAGDDHPEIGTRLVQLVPGERHEAPAAPSSPRVAGRAPTPRAPTKPAASRPVTPTPEVPLSPAPMENVAPEAVMRAPEAVMRAPEPVMRAPEPPPVPHVNTAPDPVAGSPIAALPAPEPV